MTKPFDHPMSWKEIAALCRSHLEPEEIRRLDTQIWQEILAQMAGAEPPPATLAKVGVTGVLRLPTSPRA